MVNNNKVHIKRRKQIRQEFWIVLLILTPTLAFGSPILDVTGYAHPSDGFGSKYQSTSGASYFNPARLNLTELKLQLSVRSWIQNHKIQRHDRPQGYDVPSEVFEARILNGDQLIPLEFRPLPSAEVQNPTHQTDVGHSEFVVVSLSRPIVKNRLSIGLLTVLPMGSFQKQQPYFVDERAQFFDNSLHFENYEGKFGSFVMVAATNLKIIDGFNVGLGMTLTNHSDAKPAVFVSDAARTETSLTLSNVTVKSVIQPHFGISIAPTDKWHLSGTAYFPHQSSVSGQSRLRFWDQGGEERLQEPVTFRYVYDFLPFRVNVGQEFTHRFGTINASLSGGITWYQWSKYTDRIGNKPKGFKDTLSPEMKVELSSDTHLGYVSSRFTPSNIPEQDGRTSYVDNDQIAVDFGYQFKGFPSSGRYQIGTSVQLYSFLKRQHYKRTTSADPIIDELPDSVSIQDGKSIEASNGLQTNNPGFPGFSSRGFGIIYGIMIGLNYD